VLPYLRGKKIGINKNIPNAQGLIDQAIAFPKGKHDDFTDTLIDMCKLVYAREVSILDAL
jgi:phage terminase large subunit-like protein